MPQHYTIAPLFNNHGARFITPIGVRYFQFLQTHSFIVFLFFNYLGVFFSSSWVSFFSSFWRWPFNRCSRVNNLYVLWQQCSTVEPMPFDTIYYFCDGDTRISLKGSRKQFIGIIIICIYHYFTMFPRRYFVCNSRHAKLQCISYSNNNNLMSVVAVYTTHIQTE